MPTMSSFALQETVDGTWTLPTFQETFREEEGTTTTYKPPRSPLGDYAHFRSGNVLYDGDFEAFLVNAYRFDIDDWEAQAGQRTYTLPKYDPAAAYGQSWLSGTAVDYYDLSQWVHFGGSPSLGSETYDDPRWIVSTVAPYVGDYHAMWTDSGTAASQLLAQSPGLPAGYSARVEPGDLVTFSVYARTTSGTSSNGTVRIQFFNQSGYAVSSGSSNTSTSMTTTYVLCQVGPITVPSSSYFVRATYEQSAGRVVYVDSAILTVE